MRFREIFTMAFDSLKQNKLRSGLTMLGIVVGVFSVIGVMTAIGVVQSKIESGLSELGAGTFQIQKYPSGISFGGNNSAKYANRRDITYAEGVRFKKLMEGTTNGIGMELWTGGKTATFGAAKTNPDVQVVGCDESFLGSNSYNVAYGRNLNEEDVLYSRNVMIIGADIQKKLFTNENPIGQQIKVGGKTFTIVGVLEVKGSSFGQSQDGLVMTPITKFSQDFGKEGRSVNITVQSKSQEVFEATVDKAMGAMRIARELKADQENDFEYYSNDSLISTFASIADVVRIGAFIISFIALITAGVGIMNIMLVSVTERTKEIGIRKSIGAKKNSILKQFLIEAVVLSEVGGVVGIFVGVLLGNLMALQLETSVVFPWGWALVSLVICSMIGIGFGLYPAYKAAALDPIEALRFE